jgi:hypothetical protein
VATYPENLKPVFSDGSFAKWATQHKLCSFGWLHGGLSSVYRAHGLVLEAPVPDRFSNQAVLDAAWLAVGKPTQSGASWGLRADFYAGSDAALFRSLNYFGPDGAR